MRGVEKMLSLRLLQTLSYFGILAASSYISYDALTTSESDATDLTDMFGVIAAGGIAYSVFGLVATAADLLC